ncbi:N-acetylglucosamine-6-phosphate deacetylase [Roseibium alexandrii]|uniref:N-acetylglucosamine-6-phosphate deacetylase n=1 Tax=Roseibium alexandrii (strain DSM 17067 / NCIMB 14079 / DFL-11) TaxID=244592 RepID=A0A5E8H5A2_ROSAD|nr:N-acetylglucosamine-6-phosphate deacetylase [Roseibium alexandrii]EEE47155.1 N-acetylglucosamine-6-phosphate deacetylase [Roseibium alexandrii DFL-11]
MTQTIVFKAAAVFDGGKIHEGAAVRFGPDGLVAFGAGDEIFSGADVIDLGSEIISPGFVDLQVNGGGGVMLNDDPSVETVLRIAEAHWSLGTRAFLPTLITDTREKTEAAIAAVTQAVEKDIPGVAGLHLEGPHLSVARKGAHDAAYIRPMDDEDLDFLMAAARSLPVLLLTIAPENTSLEQVRQLNQAGALVSIGHSDADFSTVQAYAAAGARCVTHLFNAMSQMGNREPGVVGAALGTGVLSAGLIADGIHVHPEMMRIALSAKSGPGEVFLVSDAMAVAGTSETSFELDGRKILRSNGRLTLEDGTLAGADLDLLTAVRVLVDQVDISLAGALRAATKTPAELIDGKPFNLLGRSKDSFIRISKDLQSLSPLAETG